MLNKFLTGQDYRSLLSASPSTVIQCKHTTAVGEVSEEVMIGVLKPPRLRIEIVVKYGYKISSRVVIPPLNPTSKRVLVVNDYLCWKRYGISTIQDDKLDGENGVLSYSRNTEL
jgi:hypothetical protein